MVEHVSGEELNVQIMKTFIWQSQNSVVVSNSGNIHNVHIMEMFIYRKRSGMEILLYMETEQRQAINLS